MQHIKQI